MNRKNVFSHLRFLILALLIALCGEGVFAVDDNTTVITIDRADSSSYRKNEKDGTDEIFLSGDVSVSVEKGSTKLAIKADEITYNRTTETLFAKGNIELVQSGTSAGEQIITATSLLVNTSTLEGFFDNGRAVHTQSDALNLPSGSTLIVASRMFGRDSSSTIAFKKAELTFCDDENPHWRIRASRIWLLPGGEFAFLNAVLSVGHVPVLYLPAFYYPKDELIFNPSFGYRERHGFYVQTTTYLLGRKPLEPQDLSNKSSTDDENKPSNADELTKGLFNFMKPSVLKEQRREGLVMHNLEEDYEGDTSHYLKVIGDYYTNLGLVTGVDGVFAPSNEYVSAVSASVRLGWTNTVFENSGNYTVYSSSGKKFKDSANFMGFHTPYRFGANFKADISKPIVFHLSMPVFSDPYFTEDFDERSEYLDWISFFMNSDSTKTTDKEDTSKQTSSFTWNADTSFKIPVPEAFSPYLTNVSVSSANASIIFNTKNRDPKLDPEWAAMQSDWSKKTPERSFFYPSQVTPIKLNGRIEGVFFQYPFPKPKTKKVPAYTTKLAVPYELLTDEEKKEYDEKKRLESEKEGDEKTAQKDSSEGEKTAQKDSDRKKDSKELVFIFREIDDVETGSITQIEDINYRLTYSINPEYSKQVNYDATNLVKSEDFKWHDIYSSYYQVAVPSTVSSNLVLKDSFASMVNNFTFNPAFQSHPNLDGYTTESSKNSVILSDYKAQKMDLTNTNTVSLKPFRFTEYFKDTGLEWNTTIKLIKTDFIGDVDHPEWEYITAKYYDEESVTIHTLSAILAAQEGEFSQSFKMTSNLPPQKDEYNGTLTFGFPYFTTTATTGLYEDVDENEVKEFKWNPLKQSATLKLFDGDLNFTESLNYNMEEKYRDSFKLSGSYKGLQVAYTMQYADVYDFDDSKKGNPWTSRDKKDFVPYSLSVAYVTQNKNYRYWKKRITWAPSLSTSVVYDFIKPTNSYFRFVPAISFNIHEQFELTFSSESQNNVIFRYVQKYVGYKDAIAGETNVFKDLYNSFAFWGGGSLWEDDQAKRKSSGFKIKNFKISVKRLLHDWSMEGNVTFKPRTITDTDGSKKFDYHPYITFCISWHPMPSMKTKLVDDYGTWSLNP